MSGLIAFLMRGRMQAILGVALTWLLAWVVMPPLGLVSLAIVALATLRNGAREGLLVVASASLVMVGIGGLLLQAPFVLALPGLMIWLPTWALATVLGATRSLPRALEGAGILGLLVVAGQYLWLDDPAGFWLSMLQQHLVLDSGAIPEDQQETLLAQLAAWMPGGVGSMWMMILIFALLLGRWSQALLEKPGAFGVEYRELRFSRGWLILVPVLLGLSFLTQSESGPGLAGQFYLVGSALFLLQGIAVAHALVHRLGKQAAWLFGFYFLMFVGAPHSVTAVAAAGYADGWLNFRAKVRGDSDQSPGPD